MLNPVQKAACPQCGNVITYSNTRGIANTVHCGNCKSSFEPTYGDIKRAVQIRRKKNRRWQSYR